MEEWGPEGTGRVLDIGCGNGLFLAEMRAKGWVVSGLDSDPGAVSIAKRLVPDAQLFCGAFEDLDFEEQGFSLIMVSHVLEHTYSPIEFLEKACVLLECDGRLVIRVPNFASPEASAFAERWRGLEIPRHLYHFSLDSLSKLLDRVGLDVADVRPHVLPMSMSQSLLYCLEDVVGHTFAAWGVAAKLLYSACYLPAIPLSLLGNWGAVEVVAVRRAGVCLNAGMARRLA